MIVGMDTELDTTPRRVGMPWAVRMDKPAFIGRAALERTAKQPDHRRLRGFTMEGHAPVEDRRSSSTARSSAMSGSWASPILGKTVMLGWLKRCRSPRRSRSMVAKPSSRRLPFYDPEGHRARA